MRENEGERRVLHPMRDFARIYRGKEDVKVRSLILWGLCDDNGSPRRRKILLSRAVGIGKIENRALLLGLARLLVKSLSAKNSGGARRIIEQVNTWRECGIS